MIVVKCPKCDKDNNVDALVETTWCKDCNYQFGIWLTMATKPLQEKIARLEERIKDLETAIRKMRSELKDARMYTARIR